MSDLRAIATGGDPVDAEDSTLLSVASGGFVVTSLQYSGPVVTKVVLYLHPKVTISPSIGAYSNPSTNYSLTVQIRTADNDGLPNEIVVGTSEAVLASAVTRDGFYSFPFETPIQLPDSLSNYAVVLVEDPPQAESSVGWVKSHMADPYDDGYRADYDSSWSAITDEDHYFKVYYSDAQQPEVVTRSISFAQEKCRQMYRSADNSLALDMRFALSFCIDGTGSMMWADPTGQRLIAPLDFVDAVLVRAPDSFVDVWTFDDTIYENTSEGLTNTPANYSAAFGTILSTGEKSRLWAAAEQSIGNLDPSSCVAAFVRDGLVNTILSAMDDAGRIDYEFLEAIDSTYSSVSGFAGIDGHGPIIDYLIQSYAETMGRYGFLFSDGYDDSGETTPENVGTLANAIAGDRKTPVYCFALGKTYDADGFKTISGATGGATHLIGSHLEKLEPSLAALITDSQKTIFQGSYEDEISFDEPTFFSDIQINASTPGTSDLTVEIALSYDSETFSPWQSVNLSEPVSLGQLIMGFKLRIKGWQGGAPGYDSPTVSSVVYHTVTPSVTYKFTPVQTGSPLEYLLSPSLTLPENASITWGIVPGDSTDWADAEEILVNRKGVFPLRKMELYFTPDVQQIGLATVSASVDRFLFQVRNDDGTIASWVDTDEISIFSNGNLVNPLADKYQLDGEGGLILFANAKGPGEVVTANILTPGAAALRQGELAIGSGRIYYARSGAWPWDAEVSVRVNDSLIRDGYATSPEEGLIWFFEEMDDDDVVTVEIDHADKYRIGYKLQNYTTAPVAEPDFGLIYSTEPETTTLYLSGQTKIPIAENVVLSPSSATLSDRLVVSYDFVQENNNREKGTTIQWYVKRVGESTYSRYADYDNRNVMRASDVPSTNQTSPFQAGDSWYVVVTPKDINNAGVAVQSNLATIGAVMPPMIVSAGITAVIAPTTDARGSLKTRRQDLIADYVYLDPNINSAESDLSTIAWYKNGSNLIQHTTATLPQAKISAGDVWFYIVTPYDGVNYGISATSEEITITQETSAIN